MERSLPSWARGLLGTGLICLLLVVSLTATRTEAAQGCRRASVAGANQPINPSRINQRLLNAAVVAEVNYLRCRKGLPRLSEASSLRRVAEGHSRWMARSRTLTHVSNLRGKRTPSERIIGTGIDVRMGSENIAKVSLYRLDGIGRFRITDASSCQFATPSGARIGRHTYASLAQYVATLWYHSKGHRRNILDGRARLVGTAAGFDGKAHHCGQIYVTQALAG